MFSFLKRNKSIFPPIEVFKNNLEDLRNTPDILQLNSHDMQNVFIYDNLMSKHLNFNLVRNDGIVCTEGFTSEPFIMFKKKLKTKTFAVAFDNSMPLTCVPRAPVLGEIMSFPPYFVSNFLDKYYDNGYVHIRRRVRINIYFREITTNRLTKRTTIKPRLQQISAWMYIGLPGFWGEKLDSGYEFGLVSRYKFEPSKPESRTYYYFDKKEIYDK